MGLLFSLRQPTADSLTLSPICRYNVWTLFFTAKEKGVYCMKNRKHGAFAAIITIALLLTGVFFFSGCSTPKTSNVQFDISQAE